MDNAQIPVGMDAGQRDLVANHLWLIKLHIVRRVPGAARGTRTQIWDDLYQEGCLGLIDAARRYDPARGIPFVAFALPRIHTAISRYLREGSALIRVPRERLAKERLARERQAEQTPARDAAAPEPTDGEGSASLVSGPGGTRPDMAGCGTTGFEMSGLPTGSAYPAGAVTPGSGERVPIVVSLDRLAGAGAPFVRPTLPGPVAEAATADDVETVGQRLRMLYERAVQQAVDRTAQGPARRADRRAVLMRIADGRLLIPSPEHRVTLRAIARETASSVGRVVKYEQRLREAVRAALTADPEVARLREVARTDPDGMNRPVDHALQRELRDAVERKFMATFFGASSDEQAELLRRLMAGCGRPVVDVVRGLYASLTREQQDDLVSKSWLLAG